MIIHLFYNAPGTSGRFFRQKLRVYKLDDSFLHQRTNYGMILEPFGREESI